VTTDRRLDRRKQLPDTFAVSLSPIDLLDGGPAIVGRAIDLTMGGIGVVVAEAIDPELTSEVWAVRIHLPDKTGRQIPLTLGGLITHGRPHPDGHLYGIKFHDLNAPAKSAERAALRQYLLSDLRDQWQGNLMMQIPSMTTG
jgi:hypothetical protein